MFGAKQNGQFYGRTPYPNARYVSCKDYHFAKEQPFRWNLLRSFLTRKKGTARNNLQKYKFVVRMSMYAVRSMSSTDASKKRVRVDDSTTLVISGWARNPS
jgi:hypothetical protein